MLSPDNFDGIIFTKYVSREYFIKYSRRKYLDKHISDENISTTISGWKYFDKIFLAKLFWWNIFDGNIVDQIFEIISGENVWSKTLAEILLIKYVWQSIGDGNILTVSE